MLGVSIMSQTCLNHVIWTWETMYFVNLQRAELEVFGSAAYVCISIFNPPVVPESTTKGLLFNFSIDKSILILHK